MNRIDLAGRTAIVTGAARGIGRAIAERLVRSGAAVEMWDANGDALATAAAELAELGAVRHSPVDVTRSAAIEAAAGAAESQWGAIDILVNNAGILGPVKDSWTHTEEDWRLVLDVVLTGTFRCSRAVLPGMLTRGYGRIVNVASISGKEGSPGLSPYTAAKAGVIGLTKSMAREVAKRGVTINCITPGTVDTAMVRDGFTPALLSYAKERIPMGRFGTVEEMAALAAWLCSADCAFSTGGVFDASGGRSSY